MLTIYIFKKIYVPSLNGALDSLCICSYSGVRLFVSQTNVTLLLSHSFVMVSLFGGAVWWDTYLGIYINQHLTWSDHCKFVSSWASKTLNLLYCLLYSCSPSAKHLSFCALVLVIIQYGCTVCLPNYNEDINHL